MITRWVAVLATMIVALTLGACATTGHESSGERDPRYARYESADGSVSYGYYDLSASNFAYSFGASSAYYPWWSVDYFYLGHHHYRPPYWWRYGHHSPWYSWHYRPWGYPYYAWGWPHRAYDPWYRYGGYDPYWYWRYRQHDGRPPVQADPPAPVGSRGGQYAGGYRPGIDENLRDRERMRRGRGGETDHGHPPEPRSVIVAPGGEDGQGMVIVGGRENKVAPSRPEPVDKAGAPPVMRTAPQPSVPVAPPSSAPPPRPSIAPTTPPPSRSFPARRETPPMGRPARSPYRGMDRGEIGGSQDDDGRPGPARFRDRD